jgi:hypothetical protein
MVTVRLAQQVAKEVWFGPIYLRISAQCLCQQDEKQAHAA